MFVYKGVKFIKTVYRPYPPLMSSLFFAGFYDRKNWKKYVGFEYQLKDTVVADKIFYYPDYHLGSFAEKVVKRIFSSKQNFLNLRRATLKGERDILAGSKNKNQRQFFVDYLNYQPTLALYHICDDYIEKEIFRLIAKRRSPEKTAQLMSCLNLPLEDNTDKKMKAWLLRYKDLEGFIKKYSWNFSRFGSYRAYSLAAAKKFLKQLERERAKSRKSDSRTLIRQAVHEAKNILGAKAYYVDVMQFFVYYRTHRTDVLNQVFFNYHDRLVKLAASIGLSYEELLYCTYGEIISKHIPDRAVLKARKKDCVVYNRLGQVHVFTGSEASMFKKLAVSQLKSGLITGQTASSGLVSGRVKIIKTEKDGYKLRPGDILVTAMTTPNMAPFMARAAAFVTDEGGITCHASILARELQKPCVIGTKNATEILKDGDIVEVDATRGTVKILQKK